MLEINGWLKYTLGKLIGLKKYLSNLQLKIIVDLWEQNLLFCSCFLWLGCIVLAILSFYCNTGTLLTIQCIQEPFGTLFILLPKDPE
jgi:hypothetical protein